MRWNDDINGRQFDITIRFRYGLHTYLTVVECKDYAAKVPVEKVEAFITKARDAMANRAVMVAANGFQSGCIEVANRHNVKLLVLSETLDTSIDHLVKGFSLGIQIVGVRFALSDAHREYELEDLNGTCSAIRSKRRTTLE